VRDGSTDRLVVDKSDVVVDSVFQELGISRTKHTTAGVKPRSQHTF